MPPPVVMPQLPGMYYDATTNRYYKLPAPNWTPNTDPPSHTPIRPTPKRPKLQSHISNLHTNHPTPISQLSSTLLSTSRRRSAPQSHFSAAATRVLPGCGTAALIVAPCTVQLRHFPTGGCIDSMACFQPVLDIAWSDVANVLAIALRGPSATRDTLRLLHFPLREHRRKSICHVEIRAKLFCIALSPSLDPVVGTHRSTEIYARREDLPAARRVASLFHADQSPALVTIRPAPHVVVSGTRAGNVFQWDLRAKPTRPVISFRPCGAACSVADLKASRRQERLYVSCMRDEEFNLAAWDLRMAGDQMPALAYREHCNSHRKLKFDVDETGSGGVLAAGGDDGLVRFWSADRGGTPLDCMEFKGEIANCVRLVCWQPSVLAECPPRPGAWVVTDRQAYVLEAGAS